MNKVFELLRRRDVSGVDPEKGVIYTCDEYASTKTVTMASRLGYRVVATGRIVPMDSTSVTPAETVSVVQPFTEVRGDESGGYILPKGCSPSYVQNGVATTALHCTSYDEFNPRPRAEFVLMREGDEVVKKYDAQLEQHTNLRKCGLLCILRAFFRREVTEYINTGEVATYRGSFGREQTLYLAAGYTPAAVLSFGSQNGNLAAFSPLPGAALRSGDIVTYLSYNYYERKYVENRAVIWGNIYFMYRDYIFKLPYAYNPNAVIARPGYSGSVVFIVPKHGDEKPQR